MTRRSGMNELPPGLVAVLTAVFGGVARTLHEWLGGRAGASWRQLCARGVVSGFMGLLGFHLFSAVRPEWTGIGCGIFGWLGGDGIPMIVRLLKRNLGAK